MDKKIFIVSHYNYTTGAPIHGPLHSIQDYLEKTKRPYSSLFHPLYTGNVSYFRFWNGKVWKEKAFGWKIKIPLPIKSVFEILSSFYFGIREKPYLYLGIDPLNTLPGVLLRKLGLTKKVVFYTVDYADKRFENTLFNNIYFLIDKIARENSDCIWNVSSRIVRKRERQGINREKIVFLPNSPDIEQVKPGPALSVNRKWILMISGVTHSQTFDQTIAGFLILVKHHPDAKLLIAGTGDYEEELKKIIAKKGLTQNVEFKGQMEHKDLVDLMKKCGLGIAFYTRDFSWTKYGDSMKAREYLAAGVPTLITDAVSTADDIKKNEAGLVVSLEKKEISKAMEKIISDKVRYEKMRKNAREVARKTDFGRILETSLQKLGV